MHNKPVTESVSCIIPAYNEERTIANPLKVALTYPGFKEVIVIDDGSADDTVKVVEKLQKKHPSLVLVKHKKNQGKAAAVLTGVMKSKSDIIVMLDADLLDLTFAHLDSLINPVASGDYAMTILDRWGDRIGILGWTATTRLFGGERAFRKQDFLAMPLDPKEGYTVEATMNTYYLKNNLKIKTIFSPGLNSVRHMKKEGFLNGIGHYGKMFWNIYRKSGFRDLYLQLTAAEDDHLSPLYKRYYKSKHPKVWRPVLLAAGVSMAVGLFVYLNYRHRIARSKK